MNAKISLLHATFRRRGGPVAIKETWLGRADHPGQIEYVFAMDEDDEESIRQTDGHHRIISPSGHGFVTAVRNWNAAASKASGDLLMVIADDLLPPEGWDTSVLGLLGRLDPLDDCFAVKVSEHSSVEGDVLLRHPVVSRAFYQSYGLFAPGYRGVFCDNDITTRAFWRAAILDGRDLRLQHEHPTVDPAENWSESHRRVNSDLEWAYGRDLYRSMWSRRQRLAQVRLVRVTAGAQASPMRLRVHRWSRCTWATIIFMLRRTGSATKCLVRTRGNP